MQAGIFHDSVRPGLVTILPRLMRFADLLAGARGAGRSLLSRALQTMLAREHRYQIGSALDVWAFGEIYRQWLGELRNRADPVECAKIDEAGFVELFRAEEGAYFDAPTVTFLGALPPQQRLTLVLVYGEGFEHEQAARILGVPADTIADRLVRMSAALADRLTGRAPSGAGATVEHLYPAKVQHD